MDTTRRERRLAATPSQDLADAEDAARTVEHRLELATLAAGIEALSPEERRILLEPGPTESRREAVRLAVRRHRIRARLASLLEGVVVGAVVVRKAVRSLATPTKVSLAALPVVVTAGLLIIPAADGPSERRSIPVASSASTPGPPSVSAQPIGAAPVRQLPIPPEQVASARESAPSEAPARPTARKVVNVDAAGTPIGVTKDRRENPPTICLFGAVPLCVDRPGPALPNPVSPALP